MRPFECPPSGTAFAAEVAGRFRVVMGARDAGTLKKAHQIDGG